MLTFLLGFALGAAGALYFAKKRGFDLRLLLKL